MVNDSEKALNEFAEQYFFKENTFSNLKFKFVDQPELELELADLVFVISQYVVAIQLKERNESERTEDVMREEKWLEKQCKEAKHQAKKTREYIRSGRLPTLLNNKGKKIEISSKTVLVPIVMFVNPTIKEYEHVLRKHSNLGYDVNCISYEDFCETCKQLVSPMEIIDYFLWRRELFKNNPKVDLLFYDASDSVSIAKPMISEASIGTYIHLRYGMSSLEDDNKYLETFRQMVHSLSTNIVAETDAGTSHFLTFLLSSFRRKEIRDFVESVANVTKLSKEGKYGIGGIVRSIESESVVFCVASENGNRYSFERLEKFLPPNLGMKFVIEIVVYWIDKESARTDYYVKSYC